MASDYFETTVLPVVQTYARKRFGRNDELVSMTLVLAWWIFRGRKEDFPPSVYAQLAARQAAAGRDLPGVRSGKTQDAYRLERLEVQGGDMAGLASRTPTPDEEAASNEHVDLFLSKLTERDSLMKEYFEMGMQNQEVATALNLTAGRVSQRRKELYNLFRTLAE